MPAELMRVREAIRLKPKPGAPADPGELREHVKRQPAAYKYPRRVWIVDELPSPPPAASGVLSCLPPLSGGSHVLRETPQPVRNEQKAFPNGRRRLLTLRTSRQAEPRQDLIYRPAAFPYIGLRRRVL
jgi:hypothetical protein